MRTSYYLSLIFLFGISFFHYGQTLTDIGPAQGFDNELQSTVDHLANGMSLYDFDEDGWDDLTFPARFDSVAFYKNINGTFVEIGSMLYSEGEMRSILWVDYDNDGDLDLCASYFDIGVRLYRNDGNFSFSDVTTSVGISPVPTTAYGISFADPDKDGDLDLYICNYGGIGFGSFPNQYYQNSNGSFSEMATQLGIENGFKTSFASSWFDFDNDDELDLHIANDRISYKDALYKNYGNDVFIDMADSLGVDNQNNFPMTSSISDFNNDGFQDIFVTNVANGDYQGVPLDYKLFQNQGGTSFTNVAQTYGLDTNAYAWGALWVDYNNDGFEDLYVATSFIDTINNPDLSSLLFLNNGGLGFTPINDSITGDIICSSYSPVKGDFNNDGFYDITVLNDNSPPNLLLNSGDNGNNSIKILPIGTVSNRQAIGAKVKVYAGGINQYQTVFCGTGLCAQYSQHMIFGVGSSTVVDSVEVIFPSGIVVKRYNLPVNQRYQIPEQVQVNIGLMPGIDTLVLCPGTSVSLGVPGYASYDWNTGSSDSIIVVSTAGNYSFQAFNQQADTVYQSSEVFVTYEAIPLYQEIITDPVCGGNNIGSIELVFGLAQDSLNVVDWSTGTQGFTLDTVPGWYTYTITTPAGCIYSGDATINAVTPFDVQFMTSPATDQDGGTVQFYIFGGVSPFTYTFDTTTVSNFIDSLPPGSYQVEIVDANGCIVLVDFIINDATTTGLSALSEDEFKVYFAEENVWICGDISTIKKIELYDMSGSKIDQNLTWEKVNDKCLRNSVNLPGGLYHVKIQGNTRENSTAVFIR